MAEMSARTAMTSMALHTAPMVGGYRDVSGRFYVIEGLDGSGTTNDCYRMTLAECRTQCYIIDGCDGITYNPQEGQGLREMLETQRDIFLGLSFPGWKRAMLLEPAEVRPINPTPPKHSQTP